MVNACGDCEEEGWIPRLVMKMPIFETNPGSFSAALAVVSQPFPIQRSESLHQLLTFARSLVVDAVATGSRRVYAMAVDDFIAWAVERNLPLTKATVQKFRVHLEARGLAPATINVRLSAIRRLASQAADNGLLDHQNAAGVARAKGTKHSGVRTGNWLSRDQAEQMLRSPNGTTLKGN